jgi:hypothetical protein
MSDELIRRAEQVEAEGRSKYGDSWGKYVDAISKVNPNGVDPAAMHQVLSQSNAADILAAGGRTAMIALADTDEIASRDYARMRDQERKEHRLSRGRGPGWA